MILTRDEAVDLTREFIATIKKEYHIYAALIWGSILNKSGDEPIDSDIDILAVVPDLNPIFKKTISVHFGLPTWHLDYRGLAIDIFFVDRSYLEDAIRNGHWTVINAVKQSEPILAHQDLVYLRSLAEEFHTFGIRTASDWLNQSIKLYQKGSELLRQKDYAHSVILSRDAGQAALYAYILNVTGAPPSPKSLLTDLKSARGSEDLLVRFLEMHGLMEIDEEKAISTQLQGQDLLQRVIATFPLRKTLK